MFRSRHLSALLLWALCLQLIVPRELWHTLCHHEDSIDCQLEGKGTTIGIHHEHCLVLELSLPPLWQKTQQFTFSQHLIFESIRTREPFNTPSVFALVSGNRGPPCIA